MAELRKFSLVPKGLETRSINKIFQNLILGKFQK